MGEYKDLSFLYDAVMEEAPYEPWFQFLQNYFGSLTSFDFVDIGCGTGKFTTMLAENAHFVTGVDLSPEMLAIANNRCEEAKLTNIRYLCQDARELELRAAVDVAVSTCDTLNYMLTEEDLEIVFGSVYRILKPGGWFGFDMLGNGRGQKLRQGVWYDVDDNRVLLYETDVSEVGRIDYDVLCFMKQDNALYRRFEEHHVQKLFNHQIITKLLLKSGFKPVVCLGDFGSSQVEEADRIIFFCEREGTSTRA